MPNNTVSFDGYIIDPNEPSIDFSQVANFDPSLLQSVFEPKSRTVLYRNPAYLFKHFEWAGKRLILKQATPIAYFGRTELVFTCSPSAQE